VRGRLLSLGEWRQGSCVPGRLLVDPDDPSGAILRTGDLVRQRTDGLLEFLGRIDEQIHIRGNRVEPAEIEHVLRHTPGVADAAILARRTAGDPVLVAFVVPALVPGVAVEPAPHDAVSASLQDIPTTRLSEDATTRLQADMTARLRDDATARLRDDATARLRATLPSYMLPTRLHVIATVPKLPGGKIDPSALERLDDAAIRNAAASRTGASIRNAPTFRRKTSIGRAVATAAEALARLRRRLGFGSA
jgi:acyl-coenzyme A synthetase/AMP-(fatty) acid ligase